jgi:hypothetical protein
MLSSCNNYDVFTRKALCTHCGQGVDCFAAIPEFTQSSHLRATVLAASEECGRILWPVYK